MHYLAFPLDYPLFASDSYKVIAFIKMNRVKRMNAVTKVTTPAAVSRRRRSRSQPRRASGLPKVSLASYVYDCQPTPGERQNMIRLH